MLSWIITFVILILILEDGVFAVLERRAFAWRARISQLKDFETAGAGSNFRNIGGARISSCHFDQRPHDTRFTRFTGVCLSH
jgi:hypothetical protein